MSHKLKTNNWEIITRNKVILFKLKNKGIKYRTGKLTL